MDWNLFKERTGETGLGGAWALPSLIFELEPGFVLAARLDRSTRSVRRLGSRDVATGSLEAGPNQFPPDGAPGLREAVEKVREVVGGENGRVGLLLPDPVVRAAILSFETLPKNSQEAEALVRWRMKEHLTYPPEEARLACQAVRRDEEGIELLTLAVRNSLVAEFESAVELKNGGPALTLPATAALLPLLPEDEGVVQLLVHACCSWLTTVIVEGSRVRSWRTRDLCRLPAVDLVPETIRETARVAASARDHLKLEIGSAWLCARPPAGVDLAAELTRTLAIEVHPLTAEEGQSAGLPAPEVELFKTLGAPVAGLIANLVGD